MTAIAPKPKCPICHFQFTNGDRPYYIVQIFDGAPVNVGVHQECRRNIHMLDPNIYPLARGLRMQRAATA